MPAGDLTGRRGEDRRAAALREVVTGAEQRSGLRFVVHVGPSAGGDPRAHAERLLDVAGRAVVVHVDPEERRVEVVTGAEAARRLDDRACALAALAMSTSFAAGDLEGGLVTGVRMLADHAGPGAA